MKLAILSHVLPPMPSGQAVMLDRLTRPFEKDHVVFIKSRGMQRQDTDARYGSRFAFYSLPRDLPARFSKYMLFGGTVMRAIRLTRILRHQSCDRILACSGDILNLPAGCLASKLARIPFTAYLFDDYVYQWQNAFYHSFALFVEPYIIRKAQTIAVPNEFLEMEYSARHGKKSDHKYMVIRNAHDYPETILSGDTFPTSASKPPTMVFSGAIYHVNYDAFRCLSAALEESSGSNVTLHIYSAQSAALLRQHGVAGSRVSFFPHMPQAQMRSIQQEANILYLPLGFDTSVPNLIRTSSPGKLGEYLASGRPILAHVPADSWVNWYFREHRCGVIVNSTEPVVLRDAIERLLVDKTLQESIVKNASKLAREEFGLTRAQDQFRRAVLFDQPVV